MARDLGAWIFDLDGVIVDADRVNAPCWKATFDRLLGDLRTAGGRAPAPFDAVRDYRLYVDGRPTVDGVRTFLAARGLQLPDGAPGDDAGTRTVHALAALNSELVEAATEQRGLHAIDGAVRFLDALRAGGARTAVVSSSGDMQSTLRAVGVEDRFDCTVDQSAADEHELDPKPAPDTLLFAAQGLGLAPERSAVVGDGPVDMEAGRAGGFSLVVGIARDDHGALLRERGADVVVDDAEGLSQLLAGHAPA